MNFGGQRKSIQANAANRHANSPLTFSEPISPGVTHWTMLRIDDALQPKPNFAGCLVTSPDFRFGLKSVAHEKLQRLSHDPIFGCAEISFAKILHSPDKFLIKTEHCQSGAL